MQHKFTFSSLSPLLVQDSALDELAITHPFALQLPNGVAVFLFLFSHFCV